VASIVADLFGVSGRQMLTALIAGERVPQAPAGQLTDHNAQLIALGLDCIDVLKRQIAELDQQIGVVVALLAAQMEQLRSIQSVGATAVRQILAEIGTDISRFGSRPRLASWAGVCSGNDESAGKRRQGRMRKENRDLRRVFVPCTSAARTPHLSWPNVPTARKAFGWEEGSRGGGTQNPADDRSSAR
jgi:transposase